MQIVHEWFYLNFPLVLQNAGVLAVANNVRSLQDLNLTLGHLCILCMCIFWLYIRPVRGVSLFHLRRFVFKRDKFLVFCPSLMQIRQLADTRTRMREKDKGGRGGGYIKKRDLHLETPSPSRDMQLAKAHLDVFSLFFFLIPLPPPPSLPGIIWVSFPAVSLFNGPIQIEWWTALEGTQYASIQRRNIFFAEINYNTFLKTGRMQKQNFSVR